MKELEKAIEKKKRWLEQFTQKEYGYWTDAHKYLVLAEKEYEMHKIVLEAAERLSQMQDLRVRDSVEWVMNIRHLLKPLAEKEPPDTALAPKQLETEESILWQHCKYLHVSYPTPDNKCFYSCNSPYKEKHDDGCEGCKALTKQPA